MRQLKSNLNINELDELDQSYLVGEWDLNANRIELNTLSLRKLIQGFSDAFDWIRIQEILLNIDPQILKNSQSNVWLNTEDPNWEEWLMNTVLNESDFENEVMTVSFDCKFETQKKSIDLYSRNPPFGSVSLFKKENRFEAFLSIYVNFFTCEFIQNGNLVDIKTAKRFDIGIESRKANRTELRKSLIMLEKNWDAEIVKWQSEISDYVDKYGFSEDCEKLTLNSE